MQLAFPRVRPTFRARRRGGWPPPWPPRTRLSSSTGRPASRQALETLLWPAEDVLTRETDGRGQVEIILFRLCVDCSRSSWLLIPKASRLLVSPCAPSPPSTCAGDRTAPTAADSCPRACVPRDPARPWLPAFSRERHEPDGRAENALWTGWSRRERLPFESWGRNTERQVQLRIGKLKKRKKIQGSVSHLNWITARA